MFLQANMSSMQVDTLLTLRAGDLAVECDDPRGRSRRCRRSWRRCWPPAQRPAHSRPSRTLDFAGPRSTQNNTDTYQMLAGLKGDILGTGWNYEAYRLRMARRRCLTEMNGLPGLQNYRAVVSGANFGQNLNLNRAGPAAVLRPEVHQRPADLHVVHALAELHRCHLHQHEASDRDEAEHRRSRSSPATCSTCPPVPVGSGLGRHLAPRTPTAGVPMISCTRTSNQLSHRPVPHQQDRRPRPM